MVGIHGIGGLGKTQLAVEYAFRHRATFSNGVVWIEADRDIDSQLVNLAQKSLWVHPETDRKTALDIASFRIRTYSDTLIVFDNVRSLDEISTLLPTPEAAPFILVTSQIELPGVSPFFLDALSEDDAVKMLQSESERAFVTADPAAIEIIHTLSSLPLAIEVAGAYLKYRPTVSLPFYLSRLQADLTGSVATAATHATSFVGHDTNLWRTLQRSEELVSDTKYLPELITLLTWCGAEPLDCEVLASMLDVEPLQLDEPIRLGVSLRLLEEFITGGEETLPRGRFRLRRVIAQSKREQDIKPKVEDVNRWIPRLLAWLTQRRLDHRSSAELDAEIGHLARAIARSSGLKS